MARFSKADKKNIARAQNQEVWEEDWSGEHFIGYRCKRCRRIFDLDILEVDHIHPQSRGGKDNPSNLQLLCPPCNKKKGAKVKPSSVKTKSIKKKTAKPVKKTTKKRRSISTKKKKPITRKASTKRKTKSSLKRRVTSKKTKNTRKTKRAK
jgi:5-methylcytosine-specific restriction endonuclease McrA